MGNERCIVAEAQFLISGDRTKDGSLIRSFVRYPRCKIAGPQFRKEFCFRYFGSSRKSLLSFFSRCVRFDSLQHENRSWKEIRSLFGEFGREGAKIGPPAIPKDTTRNTTIAPAFLFRETRADELRNCGEAIAEFKTKLCFFCTSVKLD